MGKKKVIGDKVKGVFKELKGFFYGMSSHAVMRQMLKQRMELEHLFMLVTMGDMCGLPILPPYYSLKILPYMIPNISTWKRRMLQEKDVTDMLY